MTARAARRARKREAEKFGRLDASLEYRLRRGWLVQLAAMTGSWSLLQVASQFVRIEGRPRGTSGWVRLDVRPVIERNGSISLVSVRGDR